MKKAVITGLTKISEEAYGDDGSLPDVALDIKRMETLSKQMKCKTVRLKDKKATCAGMDAEWIKAGAELGAKDFLMLYNSGHGTQIADVNGDESDNLDEALCLYDGLFLDDRVGIFLESLAPGVRVLLITDTCTSGSVTRGLKRKPRKTLFRKLKTFKPVAEIIHIAGCEDGDVAMSTGKGGALTIGLLKALKKNRSLAFGAWAETAQKLISEQKIKCTFINASKEFKDSKILG
jgi:hypothetical protein